MSDSYASWAEYYDLIYHWKSYENESRRLHDILMGQGVADGSRVLEAACGTGAYLTHLRQWYDLTGFDISEPMLSVAKERVFEIETFRADMVDFRVHKPFDAVLCLFSSIGYVHSEDALKSTASCFANAVGPGGCLIIEPWVDPEKFIVGLPTQHTFESDDLKLCRSVISKRDGDMGVLDFHWLVTPRGEDVTHFVDRHELWLCPPQLMLRVFNEAGFECHWQDDGLMQGRGLLVGLRS